MNSWLPFLAFIHPTHLSNDFRLQDMESNTSYNINILNLAKYELELSINNTNDLDKVLRNQNDTELFKEHLDLMKIWQEKFQKELEETSFSYNEFIHLLTLVF